MLSAIAFYPQQYSRARISGGLVGRWRRSYAQITHGDKRTRTVSAAEKLGISRQIQTLRDLLIPCRLDLVNCGIDWWVIGIPAPARREPGSSAFSPCSYTPRVGSAELCAIHHALVLTHYVQYICDQNGIGFAMSFVTRNPSSSLLGAVGINTLEQANSEQPPSSLNHLIL